MNEQAKILNDLLEKEHSSVLSLLSKRGKEIFFPKTGILSQSADAKGKKINATIGAALEDSGSIMSLHSLNKLFNMDAENVFPYAPSYGRKDLRDKWLSLMFEKNPSLKGTKVSLPVVTAALTHALSIVAYLFVDIDDKIIMPDLYWGNYNLIFSNSAQAKIEKYNTFKNDKLDLDAFKATLSKDGVGKKIVVLNFPNNPTGYSPLVEETEKITSILKEEADKGSEIVVIIDDAYFGLVYENGVSKESIFTNLANVHDNILAIKVDGPTKEDYVWGFRVGFVTYGIKDGSDILYNILEQKTAGAVRGNISNTANISQFALLEAYNSKTYHIEKDEKHDILTIRYELVRKIIDEHKKYEEYFTALPYNSGYFMCIKLTDTLDGEEVRHTLLNEFDTGVINLLGIIRIAYSAVPTNLLEELFENIYKACKKLSK